MVGIINTDLPLLQENNFIEIKDYAKKYLTQENACAYDQAKHGGHHKEGAMKILSISGELLFESKHKSIKATLSAALKTGVNLSAADLSAANLDFSVFPLWCGSFKIKADLRLAAQLAYHFCRIDFDCEEAKKAKQALRTLANKFHRVNECGEVRP